MLFPLPFSHLRRCFFDEYYYNNHNSQTTIIKRRSQQTKGERCTQSDLIVMSPGIRKVEVAGQKLTIHELEHVYDPLTGCSRTGSWVWESAFILSEWIAKQFDFRCKSVIELGAGAGLPGLIAARLGASRVVLTDIGLLLPGLKENVEANGLVDRVEVRELEWGSSGEEERFDVVLMSDIFYDAEEMARLALTLVMVCGEGTRVFAASELRPSTCECLSELVSHGFQVVECQSLRRENSSTPIDNDGNLETFVVYEIGRSAQLCETNYPC